LSLGEDKIVDLEDPKWDLGPLGKVVHNVIQKDLYLVFLLVGWGMMALPDMVDETYLLGVVPRIVRGFM
jgi:hypothetical protein